MPAAGPQRMIIRLNEANILFHGVDHSIARHGSVFVVVKAGINISEKPRCVISGSTQHNAVHVFEFGFTFA